jgi:hypothetical protein
MWCTTCWSNGKNVHLLKNANGRNVMQPPCKENNLPTLSKLMENLRQTLNIYKWKIIWEKMLASKKFLSNLEMSMLVRLLNYLCRNHPFPFCENYPCERQFYIPYKHIATSCVKDPRLPKDCWISRILIDSDYEFHQTSTGYKGDSHKIKYLILIYNCN